MPASSKRCLTRRVTSVLTVHQSAVLAHGRCLAEAGFAAGPDFDPAEDLARLIGAGLIIGAD